MITGQFTFDMADALCHPRDEYLGPDMPQYNLGFVTTNEPLNKWGRLIPARGRRVLTVAASGDQPLFYKLHGARHIDTFDQTINACVIMDFKTAAIPTTDYPTYRQHLNLFSNLLRARSSLDFQNIIQHMPGRSRNLIAEMQRHDQHPFWPQTVKPQFLTRSGDYDKLQKKIDGPFNFIWTDLDHLSHYLTEQYDIINLSNIFDRYKIDTHIIIAMQKLWPHLDTGGHIMLTTLHDTPRQALRTSIDWLDGRGAIWSPEAPKHSFRPIIIQKIR